MPFVKLDCGILNSTLWFERDCREIFITALLLAEPQEFLEPIKQIEVDSLAYTGWEAAPGWYGFVPAAGVGIIGRAGIEREAGFAALKKLGSPESESRNPLNEGRRLIRIDGGYLVLNFMAYRDKDHTSAERSRRYRERLRERNAVTRVNVDITGDEQNSVSQTRDITQAEAEAYLRPRVRGTARGARLPDDWQPKPENLEFCRAQNLDPVSTLENFRDHWLSVPGAKACKLDWDRTWRKWCRSDGSRVKPNGKAAPVPKEVTQRIREAYRDLLPTLKGDVNYIASVAQATPEQVRRELGILS